MAVNDGKVADVALVCDDEMWVVVEGELEEDVEKLIAIGREEVVEGHFFVHEQKVLKEVLLASFVRFGLRIFLVSCQGFRPDVLLHLDLQVVQLHLGGRLERVNLLLRDQELVFIDDNMELFLIYDLLDIVTGSFVHLG